MKSVAPLRSSCASTPMKRTRSPYFWWAAIRSDDSAMHGSHQEAQMLTSTGWPFCWAIRSWNADASSVGKASTAVGQDGPLEVVGGSPEVHETRTSTEADARARRPERDVMRAWYNRCTWTAPHATDARRSDRGDRPAAGDPAHRPV